MLRTLCLAIILTTTGFSVPVTVHAATELDRTLNEFSARHARSVVQVESYRRTQNGMRRLWSTGVVLEGGFVATCTDGAQPTDSLHIYMVDGSGGVAHFVDQDPLMGISLLALEEPLRFRPVADQADQASVREGDSVVLLSFRAGKGQMDSRVGRLKRILSGIRPGTTAQLEVVVGESRGSCGSAVLDGNGHFLGLIVECPVELSDGPLSPPRPDWVDSTHRLHALSRGTLLATVARLSLPHDPVGFLGVDATPRVVTTATRDGAELPPAPVEVLRVLAGSPAEVAGIQARDIILEIERLPIRDAEEVHERISHTPPGTNITVTVLRAGVPLSLVARVGDRSWLEWMYRRIRRNAGRQVNLRREIRELELHLSRMIQEQERYR